MGLPQQPRLLIVGYVWPEPRSSAAGSRMMQLIDTFLQQGWEIVFGSAALRGEHRVDLPGLGVREKQLALNCQSFDDFVSNFQPHLVIFDRFFTEEQFGWRVEQSCPDALRVLDTEDLHSLRLARQALLDQPAHGLLPAQSLCGRAADLHTSVSAMAVTETALREIAAIYRCDLSLMISPVEMQLLQDTFGVAPQLLHHCPFMLPPVNTATRSFDERSDFISIGNFRHPPNWDAVFCLKHTLWPAIRTHLPQARLRICGAYPPPKATALHDPGKGFCVEGWVDDALDAMAQARVCLAPLRFGAGLKGKLVDAMLTGTPSVTTPIGAEGIAGELPWPGLVTDTLGDFVEAAVALYSHQELWQAASLACQPLLRTRFDAAQQQTALLERLDITYSQREALRARNFTGRMLRHHLHKSTAYFSQWIEAKNKHG